MGIVVTENEAYKEFATGVVEIVYTIAKNVGARIGEHSAWGLEINGYWCPFNNLYWFKGQVERALGTFPEGFWEGIQEIYEEILDQLDIHDPSVRKGA